MDAETCGLAKALAYRNVELRENARVERLLVAGDGKRITGVEASIAGERKTIAAGIVILAAGAVNSAAFSSCPRENGDRQPLRLSWPAFHESQLLGRARNRPAFDQ